MTSDSNHQAFPTAPAARPAVARAEPPASFAEVEPDGEFRLRVGHVRKRIGDSSLEMLAYNGSIPGPTLRVRQGSRITVDVTNETSLETTVHWHGLRLENRYDGVPNLTQAPIPPGGGYRHHLVFPDPGLYWYHPHIREDYQQELGLYGTILVDPSDSSFWPPADRDVVWTLDDILLEDGRVARFDQRRATHTAMGRFGNVLLIGGETQQQLSAHAGEVLRLHLVNTANTRIFRVELPGARLKLIGGDAGRYERESWIEDVVLAPSERAIVDVRFGSPGSYELRHATPERRYPLATIRVAAAAGAAASAEPFERLRVNADMAAERRRVGAYLRARPDKILALVAEMDFTEPETDGPVVYVCPMHPQIVAEQPGSCPLCGMKLMPRASGSGNGSGGDGPSSHEHDHGEAMADGIEWEDLMPEVNRATNTTNMRWTIVDRETGAENSAIRWDFTPGDQVKVRLVNEMASDHPMHHPFHLHGQRFLVLSRDGVEEPNLVWKDTVLLRTGQTVDLLVDASNPGVWMAHCHIAEHMEAGMMFHFRVGA